VLVATINAGQLGGTTGYALTLDATRLVPLPVDGVVTVADVSAGVRSAQLSGVPAQCQADPAPVSVDVSTGSTARIALVVTCPGVTANGDRILFAAFLDNWELLTMAPDGSDQQVVISGPDVETEPKWSPDGGRIAFSTDRPWPPAPQGIHVLVADANGGNIRRVSTGVNEKSGVGWSPDGLRVAFGEPFTGLMRLWAGNADGSGAVVLTFGPETGEYPAWSPDGTEIVYATGASRLTDTDLFLMNADGSNHRLLVQRPGVDRYPVWSPDGRKIAFEGVSGAGKDVFLINRDGTGLLNLTARARPGFDNREPGWSPDGTKVLFVSAPVGSLAFDVYVMDVDGRNLRQLTTLPSRERFPDWRRVQ
jgi:TolB protein